ncbi:hypothetical protein [Myroides odoratimimus]|uniref:hypothetical protein n=1 Tax=Myroides odoratimimus TaxID=76832 RepID=UPI000469F368|nr:hypothetical protein [Myroides odoratimimus]
MNIEALRSTLENTINNNLTHANYDHVCNLASEYEAFITDEKNEQGERKLNTYLRQFVRREDNDLFEQRKNITKHYTPSICAQIIRTFEKVIRSNKVQKLVEHKDNSKVEEIQQSIDKFYGDSHDNGVDKYLNERFKILTFTDPNSWIWVNFKPFDYRFEKPQAYPLEISSKQAINFKIVNGKAEWLVAKFSYKYQCKDNKTKEAIRYIIFSDDNHVEYKEIPKDIRTPFIDWDDIYENKKKNKKYAVYFYEHKLKTLPLQRVGYRPDIETKSETFVNPFHYEAMPLLRQFIKVSSELQLSITLHTFPKQIAYVSPCTAKGCNSGRLAEGKTCDDCGGTGVKRTHTTAADVVELPMPKNVSDVVDASRLAAYIPFPNDVMKFLDEYVDKLEKKIIRMVFNSESLMQTRFSTATEVEVDVDSIYDTLNPFAQKYSEMWMFIVKVISELLFDEVDSFLIWHKYPTDFKLKTMGQLLQELKLANESGAPSYIREGLNNDISEIIYADDQDELAKLRTKNRFYPFPGKTDLEIQNIIIQNLTTKRMQVLYANFDNIFDSIELEIPEFYNMALGKQRSIIDDKVNILMEELQDVTKPSFVID